ncbi:MULTISPECIES: MTH865 family protein [Haloarcula]|uniref:MTH865 family protein n=1 Tax=Haloarcula TaxID=2237 RepID=UPI0023E85827|nr:MTH865 family protein [Halomicroarcula sp. SHR3]
MTSDSTEACLREQFATTFGQATFPLRDPFELLPLLPDGPATEFEAGSVVVPAIDLGMVYGTYQTYPYDSVDALVDDLIHGLKQEGVL